jgi:hypothetical protein
VGVLSASVPSLISFTAFEEAQSITVVRLSRVLDDLLVEKMTEVERRRLPPLGLGKGVEAGNVVVD